MSHSLSLTLPFSLSLLLSHIFSITTVCMCVCVWWHMMLNSLCLSLFNVWQTLLLICAICSHFYLLIQVYELNMYCETPSDAVVQLHSSLEKIMESRLRIGITTVGEVSLYVSLSSSFCFLCFIWLSYLPQHSWYTCSVDSSFTESIISVGHQGRRICCSWCIFNSASKIIFCRKKCDVLKDSAWLVALW